MQLNSKISHIDLVSAVVMAFLYGAFFGISWLLEGIRPDYRNLRDYHDQQHCDTGISDGFRPAMSGRVRDTFPYADPQRCGK
jgi:hypothetical protein